MKKSPSSPWLRLTLILLGCSLLVAMLLPLIKPPFAVVFGGLALASLLCGIFIKKPWVTYAAMILLPLFAVASIMEAHLKNMRDPAAPTREEGSYSKSWNLNDPVCGYGPKAEQGIYDSRAWRGDTKLYDVVYHTTEKGWRITPPAPQADTAVLFFGCSFTLGFGVQDAESYPYQVGKLLGSAYQVYNFGFRGYGSHQFLAMVESGKFDDILNKYKKIHIFYLNISHHEMRPAGYSEWDTHGPRYVLQNGVAVREGNFAPWWNASATARQVHEILKQSFLYNDLFVRPREWALKDMRVLDNTLIRQARDLLLQKHPDSQFTLMVYPDAVRHLPQQKNMGLNPVDLTAFFPQPPTDARYFIPGEWHPSAEAYRVMAEGIVSMIRGKDASKPEAMQPSTLGQ